MNCCDSRDIHFGKKHAIRDLERYNNKGPDRTTRIILDAIRVRDFNDATLLDAGAGIGVIQYELLGSECSSATHVDLSSAYIDAAKKEGARRGLTEQIRYVHGDLVLSADLFDSTDIVVLDRVVCCYPDFQGILSVASEKCSRLLVMSYPRDRWFVRLGSLIDNLKRKFKGDPFRTFVHREHDVQSIPEGHGLKMAQVGKTPIWRIEVYTR